MDNFRKFDTPRRSARSGVDGFNANGRKDAPRLSRRGVIADKTSSSSRVDNFRGKDGFRPNTQNSVASSAAPTILDSPRHSSGKSIGDKPGKGVKLDLPKSTGKKKQRSKKKKIVRIALVLFLLLVLVGGLFFGNAYLKARKIFGGGGNAPALDANVDPAKLNGEGDGRVNIMLLGKGGPGHDGADLTDTILIACIDPVQKETSLLSIPRDFWVKTEGGQSKINAVYANAKYKILNTKKSADTNERAEQAGLSAIETTVEEVTGIPIHYHVMVDFEAFEQAINTVGGININVQKNGVVYERLYNTVTRKPYILDVKEGQQQFNGERALFYARSRYTSARGDFDRAERQRAVIVALKDKVTSAGTYGNPVKINQLVNEFGSHVRSNLATGEVLRVYDILKNVDSSKIGSVGLADAPNILVETDTVNGQSVVRPIAGLYNYSAIQSFIRNTLKEDTMRYLAGVSGSASCLVLIIS